MTTFGDAIFLPVLAVFTAIGILLIIWIVIELLSGKFPKLERIIKYIDNLMDFILNGL